MKRICLLTLFLLIGFFNAKAQVIDVLTDLLGPQGILLNGNDLYVCEPHTTRVFKIDISDIAQTPTDVIHQYSGQEFPRSLALKGDMLYFSDYLGFKIQKVNINATLPTTTSNLVHNLSYPNCMVFNGNDLYFSQSLQNKISKVDISAPTPTVTEIITGLDHPTGLAFNGDDLYFSQSGANKISKIDISIATPTVVDVVTNLSIPIELALNGDDLYFAQYGTNRISKIDISIATPTVVDVVTGLDGPYGLALNETDLYFSQASGDKISKINLSSLSTNEFSTINSIKVYPNPSTDFINISGLIETKRFKIYNILGVEMLIGIISRNEKIDIKNLKNGIYFLKFDDGNTVKFIKD
ncbi:T9SS type A sorting domain-containing protein [Winogradskyella sp.]|uniref:T9SS type A sorting domain-containing protein n=1 Tax=Winogradskyella sp. TaxID=1883156 RepID=UPI003BAA2B33